MNALNAARPMLAMYISDFDKDPNMLNTPLGTYDLARPRRRFSPHSYPIHGRWRSRRWIFRSHHRHNAKITGKSDIKNYADYLVDEAGPAIMKWIVEGAEKAIGTHFQKKVLRILKPQSHNHPSVVLPAFGETSLLQRTVKITSPECHCRVTVMAVISKLFPI